MAAQNTQKKTSSAKDNNLNTKVPYGAVPFCVIV